MSNGKIKTKLMKVPEEWCNILDEAIKQINRNGYEKKIHQTEIMRLLIHLIPARNKLNESLGIIINGFKGVKEVRPEVEIWMKGYVKLQPMEDVI